MPIYLLLIVFAAIAFVSYATARFIKTEPYRCWHQEPEQPYDIDDAHTVMQALINCSIESCPAKHSAWRTLVEAKHIRPSTERQRR
jgi:hypothetical protein